LAHDFAHSTVPARVAARLLEPGRRRPCHAELDIITTFAREMPDLELALLRRSVHELARESERCARCGRSPLVGERMYVLAGGATVCELCRPVERAEPVQSLTIRGPAFGHTLRIVDRRARDAARAARAARAA
jgi:hypothetical protein